MLKRLYANNYRCFVNFEVRPARTGLLLGYNGVGKSSVFDVIGAIQDLIVMNEEVSEAFLSDTLSRFSDERSQRFEIDVESPHGSISYALLLHHDPEREACTIVSEEVAATSPTGDRERLYFFEKGEVHLAGADLMGVRSFPFSNQRSYLSSIDEQPVHSKLIWFLNFVRGIWILKLDPQNTIGSARKDETTLSRDGTNFSSWCRHFILESRERLEAAEVQLRSVMPGFQSLNFQAAGRSRVLVARFSPSAGRKAIEIDFDMLSDGQRALIILYVLVNAFGSEAHTLCLDEPDNFVSIREIQPFLMELANAADDNQRQFLLVSHSSEVIDFFGAHSAVLLERPDGGHTRVVEMQGGPGLRLSEYMARGWHGAS